MLEIRNIVKGYGHKEVLRDISIHLEKGIYGLLGVNGAGKTTLINIVTGLMQPDHGQVLFEGIDIHNKKCKYQKTLGYMPQYTTFYPDFTAREFLKYISVIKGVAKKDRNNVIDQLLQKVNLEKEADNKIKTFSGGMRQRLGIAQALVNNPKILILDEPTAGLDPAERIRFRNLISDLAIDRIVILATHIVQDVEYIANQVIILNEGKIVAFDKPNKLLEQLENRVGIISLANTEVEEQFEKHVMSNIFHEEGNSQLRVIVEDARKECVEVMTPNLEDLFLFYTQKGKK